MASNDYNQNSDNQTDSEFDQTRNLLDKLKKRASTLQESKGKDKKISEAIRNFINKQNVLRAELDIAEADNDLARLEQLKRERIFSLNKEIGQLEEQGIVEEKKITENKIQIGAERKAETVYKNPSTDPSIQSVEKDIEDRTNQDEDVKKAFDSKSAEYEKIWNEKNAHISSKSWKKYIDEHPEKAEIYKTSYEPIRTTLEAIEKEKQDTLVETKTQNLKENLNFKNFIYDPEKGLHSKVFKDEPEFMTVGEYNKKAQSLLAEMEEEFRKENPEISERYPPEERSDEKEEEEKREENPLDQARDLKKQLEEPETRQVEAGKAEEGLTRETSQEITENAAKGMEEGVSEGIAPEAAEVAPGIGEGAGAAAEEAVIGGETAEAAAFTEAGAGGVVEASAVSAGAAEAGALEAGAAAGATEAGVVGSGVAAGGTAVVAGGGAAATGGTVAGGAAAGVGAGGTAAAGAATGGAIAAGGAAVAAGEAAGGTVAVGIGTAGIVIIIVLIIIIVIAIIAVAVSEVLKKFPVGTGTITPVPTVSVTPPVNGCLFYRGDQNPPGARYQSNTLLGYFQQAAAASGVPATVLAGIARIESPGIVNYTDANLSSYGCPTSSAGALGLMQIMPVWLSYASPVAGIQLGAQYLGLPFSMFTDPNNTSAYCDIKNSIFLGAGVINSKVGGSWDPAQTNNQNYIYNVARGYYGCLLYPSCSSGPYSYGQDLWNSVSSCSTTAPPPPGSGNIVNWANQIIQNLQQGAGGSYNILNTSFTNGTYTAAPSSNYWCTYLVVDAYNLAGFSGMNRGAQGAVVNMVSYFQNNYTFLDYMNGNHQTVLSSLQPGYVIFWEQTPGVYTGNEHAGIVYSSSINSNGDGVITTYESNASVTSRTITVSNWNIFNPMSTMSIVGFGGR